MTAPAFPSNANNSATGGYLIPAAPGLAPGGLTFEQFVQTVLVGLSGLPGNLVRDKWQMDPPIQPDICTNWLSFGLSEVDFDTNAYTGIDGSGNNQFMRMEALTLDCSFYGPQALEYCRLVRDNLQIKQNLEVLQSAKMNFASTGKMVRAPDIVNERWCNRWQMSVFLRREIIRVYPVLTLLSGLGTLDVNVGSGLATRAITIDD